MKKKEFNTKIDLLINKNIEINKILKNTYIWFDIILNIIYNNQKIVEIRKRKDKDIGNNTFHPICINWSYL